MGGATDELGGTTPIPTYLVVLAFGAVFGGGAGFSTFLNPRLETAAYEQCANNAEIALEVAADHSREIVDILDRLRTYRDFVVERTQDNYTAQEASRVKAVQRERDEQQERHLREIDRRLGALEE